MPSPTAHRDGKITWWIPLHAKDFPWDEYLRLRLKLPKPPKVMLPYNLVPYRLYLPLRSIQTAGDAAHSTDEFTLAALDTGCEYSFLACEPDMPKFVGGEWRSLRSSCFRQSRDRIRGAVVEVATTPLVAHFPGRDGAEQIVLQGARILVGKDDSRSIVSSPLMGTKAMIDNGISIQIRPGPGKDDYLKKMGVEARFALFRSEASGD